MTSLHSNARAEHETVLEPPRYSSVIKRNQLSPRKIGFQRIHQLIPTAAQTGSSNYGLNAGSLVTCDCTKYHSAMPEGPCCSRRPSMPGLCETLGGPECRMLNLFYEGRSEMDRPSHDRQSFRGIPATIRGRREQGMVRAKMEEIVACVDGGRRGR